MSDNGTNIISRQDSKKRIRTETAIPGETNDQDSKHEEGTARSRWRSCTRGNDKKATYANEIPQSATGRIKNSPLPTDREESSDEGSDQDSFSTFDNTSYAARNTNTPGFAVGSNEFNNQSDQAGEPNKLKQDDMEKRMEANRLRAKATRRKKKVMIDEMRSRIFILSVENEQLKIQHRNQQREIEFLRNIQGHQFLSSMQVLSYPAQPPLPNSNTYNDAARIHADATQSDSRASYANVISSAAPTSSYLDLQNQLLLFGGAAALHPSSLPRQNTGASQAIDRSTSSQTAFLSTPGLGDAYTSSGQIGSSGGQNESRFVSYQEGAQRFFQQTSTQTAEDQNRRDRLLLQLLIEKHSKNSMADI